MGELKLSTNVLTALDSMNRVRPVCFKFSPAYRKCEPKDSGLRQSNNFRHALVTVRHFPFQSSLRSLYTRPSSSSVAGSISRNLRFVMLSITTRD